MTRTPASAACRTSRGIPATQPFPHAGTLVDNTNLPLDILSAQIRKSRDRAYSYIVRTVKLDRATSSFQQHGSAPNFQGGILTLCTCKHQMRTTQAADEWQGTWIAGFTSRTLHEGRHWLYYLAKVESAYESHSDLWRSMTAVSRNAKAAHEHFLGDLFKPKTKRLMGDARFVPGSYVAPTRHTHRRHRSDKAWHNDIHYRHAHKLGHPALLVANPRLTYLWAEPMISLAQNHCRNYHKWSSLGELLASLRGAY